MTQRLTKNQIEKYMDTPECCPFCGCMNTEFDGELTTSFSEEVGNEIRQPCVCATCKGSWIEVYGLIDIEDSETTYEPTYSTAVDEIIFQGRPVHDGLADKDKRLLILAICDQWKVPSISANYVADKVFSHLNN